MLAASADGTSGATARLIPQFEHSPEVTIVFTGYVNPTTPAERLTKSGRAQSMRWNVHPLLSDTVALVRAIAGGNRDPRFLRPRQACRACRGACAGAGDDG